MSRRPFHHASADHVRKPCISYASHPFLTLPPQNPPLIPPRSAAAASKKAKGVELKPAHVKNFMHLFVNCLVENPAFDSQVRAITARGVPCSWAVPLPLLG